MKYEPKKDYRQPVLHTVEIQLGVFGSYGEDFGRCDDPRPGHGGRHGGGGIGGWRGIGD